MQSLLLSWDPNTPDENLIQAQLEELPAPPLVTAGRYELSIEPRSLMGILYYLSHAIRVPPEHEAAGLVTVTMTEYGEAFDVRVANIRGTSTGATFEQRLNGDFYLRTDGPAATVFDDGQKDTLTGSAGADWFFAQLDGENQAAKDKITDLGAAEFAEDLEFVLKD